MKTLAIVTMLSLFSVTCHAGASNYRCTIKSVMETNTNGVLTKAPSKKLKAFSVDRNDGSVTGGPFDNASYGDIQVVNHGDSGSPFQVFMNDGFKSDYLQVMEYAKPDKKPFIGIDYLGTVYSGICE